MDNKYEALNLWLTTLARIYQDSRINIKNKKWNWVYTVMASNIATLASNSPEEINNKEFKLKEVWDDAEIILEDFPKINLEKFHKINNLEKIPWKTILPIWMWWGSDWIQAAQLWKLLKEAWKNIPAVISVRTNKTESQWLNWNIWEDRTPKKNAEEIYNWVYIINQDTEMKWRALEPIISNDIQTILILIKNEITLEKQIEFTKNYLWNIDTIIWVDTGWDALYSNHWMDNSKATPDQDIEVLTAINNIAWINTFSAEIAIWVDTPADWEEKLQKAEAVYFEPDQESINTILSNYSNWQLDWTNDEYFWKTALAWQKALQNKFWITSLDLPTRVVTDPKNPWNNFVNIQKATKWIFFMETQKHLDSIKKLAN
jgi:hypothetical protein